jgi:hypothetical protein
MVAPDNSSTTKRKEPGGEPHRHYRGDTAGAWHRRRQERMTPTELTLTAIHKGPVIPLADICEKYLSNNYDTARRKAALHVLPFPAFQLDETNRKSAWLVRASDLAAYLDAKSALARAAWQKSQL